jgi:hypothetical protein
MILFYCPIFFHSSLRKTRHWFLAYQESRCCYLRLLCLQPLEFAFAELMSVADLQFDYSDK